MTEWTDDLTNDIVLQHDCLVVLTSMNETVYTPQVITYCLGEWPSKWQIQNKSSHQKFTFSDLWKNNITSEQLYSWSAPMDVIEKYQLYLNRRSISNDTLQSTHIYYNCTLPWFGPLCQYTLDDQNSNHVSLNEVIYDYYSDGYKPSALTCYTLLQCDLGSSLLCINWENICDGIIQCMDGIDEKYCWQLETNECKENEYRCIYGQCIPSSFVDDGKILADCLDGTDMHIVENEGVDPIREPTSRSEDIFCWDIYAFSILHRYSDWTLVSCSYTYTRLFFDLISPITDSSIPNDCWLALQCYLKYGDRSDLNCDSIHARKLIEEKCPDEIFYIPPVPLAFGHIYTAYTKKYILDQTIPPNLPEYVCFDKELCGKFYSNVTLISFGNVTCQPVSNFPSLLDSIGRYRDIVVMSFVFVHELFTQCNTLIQKDSTFCDHPGMYKCVNSSKCIAKSRLFDLNIDCAFEDDEFIERQTAISNSSRLENSPMHFYCPYTDKWISRKLLFNQQCDCYNSTSTCFDRTDGLERIRQHISFPTICNGFTDLNALIIDGQSHTDETECEQWLCNNTYTRCNGYWDCFDGADEVDCYPPSLINCPPHSHVCISSNASNFICLSMDKGNDGHIDCIGATDEPQICRQNRSRYNTGFYCVGTNKVPQCAHTGYLCRGKDKKHCIRGEDELFCHLVPNPSLFHTSSTLKKDDYDTSLYNETDWFLSNLFKFTPPGKIVYSSLHRNAESSENIRETNTMMRTKDSITAKTSSSRQQRCHRGLNLKVWLYDQENSTEQACLCPPSYYGDTCQYQNQRVSLTMKFRTYSDSWRTVFTIIVSLIDYSDKRTIHAYEQFTYFPMKKCQTKFTMYLLYSMRPKNESEEYFIHIDIYEKLSLSYRGSLLVPIPFVFLPVQRISVLLTIPHTTFPLESCSSYQCIHGRCIRYFDQPENTTFCQCNQGWTGKFCHIPYNCTCSSGSICSGILANNRPICICPVDKWSSQCLLDDQICKSNKVCRNGGYCVPINQNVAYNKRKFECICPEGFTGETCELSSNKMVLSFEKNIILPETMRIYFMEINDDVPPETGLSFKVVPLDRTPSVIYWPHPYHIAFVELSLKNYYLITVQKTFNSSTPMERIVKLSDYCPSIAEIFNESFTELQILRRIKYFHIPCQNSSRRLPCFHDANYFCLCNDYGDTREANCFDFNQTTKHDCFGKSHCENGAECLQDSITCPQSSMCICPPCFYGSRCQFSSNKFSLVLDAILGYHIQPNINIIHQPVIVRTSLALTILLTSVGIINGILSIVTLNNKELCKNGCCIYLISSSITTLILVIMCSLKFGILIGAQILNVSNRSFLSFQCITIDYFLRIGLNMTEWLNACVSLERAIIAVQKTKFNRKNSRKIAKLIIAALFILITTTNIHDPIYRRLLDENNNDQKRIWCTVRYSANVQVFNQVMHIFHFCTPFVINFISLLIIIRETTQLKVKTKGPTSSKKILFKQIQQHKHLIISSLVLVLLTIPRLIITFAGGCMKTAADSWWFLVLYVISFVPSTLTFVIFILPSKVYMQEFKKTVVRHRRAIQRSAFFSR